MKTFFSWIVGSVLVVSLFTYLGLFAVRAETIYCNPIDSYEVKTRYINGHNYIIFVAGTGIAVVHDESCYGKHNR